MHSEALQLGSSWAWLLPLGWGEGLAGKVAVQTRSCFEAALVPHCSGLSTGCLSVLPAGQLASPRARDRQKPHSGQSLSPAHTLGGRREGQGTVDLALVL